MSKSCTWAEQKARTIQNDQFDKELNPASEESVESTLADASVDSIGADAAEAAAGGAMGGVMGLAMVVLPIALQFLFGNSGNNNGVTNALNNINSELHTLSNQLGFIQSILTNDIGVESTLAAITSADNSSQLTIIANQLVQEKAQNNKYRYYYYTNQIREHISKLREIVSVYDNNFFKKVGSNGYRGTNYMYTQLSNRALLLPNGDFLSTRIFDIISPTLNFLLNPSPFLNTIDYNFFWTELLNNISMLLRLLKASIQTSYTVNTSEPIYIRFHPQDSLNIGRQKMNSLQRSISNFAHVVQSGLINSGYITTFNMTYYAGEQNESNFYLDLIGKIVTNYPITNDTTAIMQSYITKTKEKLADTSIDLTDRANTIFTFISRVQFNSWSLHIKTSSIVNTAGLFVNTPEVLTKSTVYLDGFKGLLNSAYLEETLVPNQQYIVVMEYLSGKIMIIGRAIGPRLYFKNGTWPDITQQTASLSGANTTLTITSVSGDTIVLNPDPLFSGTVDGDFVGCFLQIASGTSAGQMYIVKGYTATTRSVKLDRNLPTTVASSVEIILFSPNILLPGDDRGVIKGLQLSNPLKPTGAKPVLYDPDGLEPTETHVYIDWYSWNNSRDNFFFGTLSGWASQIGSVPLYASSSTFSTENGKYQTIKLIYSSPELYSIQSFNNYVQVQQNTSIWFPGYAIKWKELEHLDTIDENPFRILEVEGPDFSPSTIFPWQNNGSDVQKVGNKYYFVVKYFTGNTRVDEQIFDQSNWTTLQIYKDGVPVNIYTCLDPGALNQDDLYVISSEVTLRMYNNLKNKIVESDNSWWRIRIMNMRLKSQLVEQLNIGTTRPFSTSGEENNIPTYIQTNPTIKLIDYNFLSDYLNPLYSYNTNLEDLLNVNTTSVLLNDIAQIVYKNGSNFQIFYGSPSIQRNTVENRTLYNIAYTARPPQALNPIVDTYGNNAIRIVYTKIHTLQQELQASSGSISRMKSYFANNFATIISYIQNSFIARGTGDLASTKSIVDGLVGNFMNTNENILPFWYNNRNGMQNTLIGQELLSEAHSVPSAAGLDTYPTTNTSNILSPDFAMSNFDSAWDLLNSSNSFIINYDFEITHFDVPPDRYTNSINLGILDSISTVNQVYPATDFSTLLAEYKTALQSGMESDINNKLQEIASLVFDNIVVPQVPFLTYLTNQGNGQGQVVTIQGHIQDNLNAHHSWPGSTIWYSHTATSSFGTTDAGNMGFVGVGVTGGYNKSKTAGINIFQNIEAENAYPLLLEIIQNANANGTFQVLQPSEIKIGRLQFPGFAIAHANLFKSAIYTWRYVLYRILQVRVDIELASEIRYDETHPITLPPVLFSKIVQKSDLIYWDYPNTNFAQALYKKHSELIGNSGTKMLDIRGGEIAGSENKNTITIPYALSRWSFEGESMENYFYILEQGYKTPDVPENSLNPALYKTSDSYYDRDFRMPFGGAFGYAARNNVTQSSDITLTSLGSTNLYIINKHDDNYFYSPQSIANTNSQPRSASIASKVFFGAGTMTVKFCTTRSNLGTFSYNTPIPPGYTGPTGPPGYTDYSNLREYIKQAGNPVGNFVNITNIILRLELSHYVPGTFNDTQYVQSWLNNNDISNIDTKATFPLYNLMQKIAITKLYLEKYKDETPMSLTTLLLSKGIVFGILIDEIDYLMGYVTGILRSYGTKIGFWFNHENDIHVPAKISDSRSSQWISKRNFEIYSGDLSQASQWKENIGIEFPGSYSYLIMSQLNTTTATSIIYRIMGLRHYVSGSYIVFIMRAVSLSKTRNNLDSKDIYLQYGTSLNINSPFLSAFSADKLTQVSNITADNQIMVEENNGQMLITFSISGSKVLSEQNQLLGQNLTNTTFEFMLANAVVKGGTDINEGTIGTPAKPSVYSNQYSKAFVSLNHKMSSEIQLQHGSVNVFDGKDHILTIKRDLPTSEIENGSISIILDGIQLTNITSIVPNKAMRFYMGLYSETPEDATQYNLITTNLIVKRCTFTPACNNNVFIYPQITDQMDGIDCTTSIPNTLGPGLWKSQTDQYSKKLINLVYVTFPNTDSTFLPGFHTYSSSGYSFTFEVGKTNNLISVYQNYVPDNFNPHTFMPSIPHIPAGTLGPGSPGLTINPQEVTTIEPSALPISNNIQPYVPGIYNNLHNGSGVNYVVIATSGSTQISTSPDGNNWTFRGNPVGGEGTMSVAYNGNIWVIAGFFGNPFYYSYDGVLWNPSPTSFVNRTIRSIIWNGKIFVATQQINPLGNETKYMLWSDDGINWNEAITTQSPYIFSPQSVAWNTNTSTFIVIGQSGKISKSNDGKNWTSARELPYIALFPPNILPETFTVIRTNGTIWLTTAGNIGNNIFYSNSLTPWEDINSWSQHDGKINTINDMAWSPTKFIWVAVGEGNEAAVASYSINGTDWIAASLPQPAYSMQSVIWDSIQNRFMAISFSITPPISINSPTNSNIFYSADGKTWNIEPSALPLPDNNLPAVSGLASVGPGELHVSKDRFTVTVGSNKNITAVKQVSGNSLGTVVIPQNSLGTGSGQFTITPGNYNNVNTIPAPLTATGSKAYPQDTVYNLLSSGNGPTGANLYTGITGVSGVTLVQLPGQEVETNASFAQFYAATGTDLYTSIGYTGPTAPRPTIQTLIDDYKTKAGPIGFKYVNDVFGFYGLNKNRDVINGDVIINNNSDVTSYIDIDYIGTAPIFTPKTIGISGLTNQDQPPDVEENNTVGDQDISLKETLNIETSFIQISADIDESGNKLVYSEQVSSQSMGVSYYSRSSNSVTFGTKRQFISLPFNSTGYVVRISDNGKWLYVAALGGISTYLYILNSSDTWIIYQEIAITAQGTTQGAIQAIDIDHDGSCIVLATTQPHKNTTDIVILNRDDNGHITTPNYVIMCEERCVRHITVNNTGDTLALISNSPGTDIGELIIAERGTGNAWNILISIHLDNVVDIKASIQPSRITSWYPNLEFDASGNTLVVGMPSANSNTGKILIYTKTEMPHPISPINVSTWSLFDTINGTNYLGATVDISSDGTLIVAGNASTPVIYVLGTSGWEQSSNTINAITGITANIVRVSGNGNTVVFNNQIYQ